MNELIEKENELREDRNSLIELKDAKKEEINKCIEQDVDYSDKEWEYNRITDKIRELDKKIEILENAEDVLSGIGV